MIQVTQRRNRAQRRGSAAVTMLLLLLMTNLVVIGIVLRSAGEHELTAQRMETVQSFYATEGGMNMAIRELMRLEDEDSDGGIGSISDDGNDANNPAIGTGNVLVTRAYSNTTVNVEATGLVNATRRRIQCDVEIGERVEFGSVVVAGALQTVNLQQDYHRPIVICTLRHNNNSWPMVVRVDNVMRDSFDVRLQNPGGAQTPAADTVYYMVVEEGTWEIDDARFEAQQYLSTVTDNNSRWNAELQVYEQSYVNPIVVGQVMTINDPLWSVFWCRGGSAGSPPTSAALRTGKTVAEDPNRVRAAEQVGFVVFERGHGMLGTFEFDALLTPDYVRGYTNGPPWYGVFSVPFAAPPPIVIASQAAMDGNNGGWVYVYRTTTSPTQVPLVIDEDQLLDIERDHTTEQVGFIAFDQLGFHEGPKDRVLTWADVKAY